MKRIKFWQVCMIFALVIVMIASCNKDDDTTFERLFDITLPSGWLHQYYDDETVLYYAQSPIRVEDDEQLIQDTLLEDLLITREYLPGFDLEVYYVAVTSELASKPTYLEVYATDTIINGQNSKKLIHLDTIRLASQVIPNDSFDLGLKPIKYFFYKDDYAYLIDCGALPFTFDYYKPIFDDIVGSFTFKN